MTRAVCVVSVSVVAAEMFVCAELTLTLQVPALASLLVHLQALVTL